MESSRAYHLAMTAAKSCSLRTRWEEDTRKTTPQAGCFAYVLLEQGSRAASQSEKRAFRQLASDWGIAAKKRLRGARERHRVGAVVAV